MLTSVARTVSRSASRTVNAGLRRQFSAAQTFLDKAEVEERVLGVVRNYEKVDVSKVTPSANFVNDLGLDSLDTVEVVMAMEEEFVIEIPDAEAEKIQSCSDAITFIANTELCSEPQSHPRNT